MQKTPLIKILLLSCLHSSPREQQHTRAQHTALTSTAFLFFRSALFSLACFWTEAKAREKLSSPTSFLSNSMISWDRFFSRGSKHTEKDERQSHIKAFQLPWHHDRSLSFNKSMAPELLRWEGAAPVASTLARMQEETRL